MPPHLSPQLHQHKLHSIDERVRKNDLPSKPMTAQHKASAKLVSRAQDYFDKIAPDNALGISTEPPIKELRLPLEAKATTPLSEDSFAELSWEEATEMMGTKQGKQNRSHVAATVWPDSPRPMQGATSQRRVSVAPLGETPKFDIQALQQEPTDIRAKELAAPFGDTKLQAVKSDEDPTGAGGASDKAKSPLLSVATSSSQRAPSPTGEVPELAIDPSADEDCELGPYAGAQFAINLGVRAAAVATAVASLPVALCALKLGLAGAVPAGLSASALGVSLCFFALTVGSVAVMVLSAKMLTHYASSIASSVTLLREEEGLTKAVLDHCYASFDGLFGELMYLGQKNKVASSMVAANFLIVSVAMTAFFPLAGLALSQVNLMAMDVLFCPQPLSKPA